MNMHSSDLSTLGIGEAVTLSYLSEISTMTTDELDELVDYGALIPISSAEDERFFNVECAPLLRAAAKLKKDFYLDLFTVALILGYLKRIEALEAEICFLKAHLPENA